MKILGPHPRRINSGIVGDRKGEEICVLTSDAQASVRTIA